MSNTSASSSHAAAAANGSNSGGVEHAVRQVQAAVSSLHAQIEALKAQKAVLLRDTAAAAKAAAAAQRQEPRRAAGRKRGAAHAGSSSSSDNGDDSDAAAAAASGDSSEPDSADDGSGAERGAQGRRQRQGAQDQDTCLGPAWQLFQALQATTQQAAGSQHERQPGQQQHSPTATLHALEHACLQQLGGGAATSTSADAAACCAELEAALLSGEAHSPLDPGIFGGSTSTSTQPPGCCDVLARLDAMMQQQHKEEGEAVCLQQPPAAASEPVFSAAALLREFEQQVAESSSSGHDDGAAEQLLQPAHAAVPLIAGRFMLLSVSADSTPAPQDDGGDEVELPSYLRQLIVPRQQPAGPAGRRQPPSEALPAGSPDSLMPSQGGAAAAAPSPLPDRGTSAATGGRPAQQATVAAPAAAAVAAAARQHLLAQLMALDAAGDLDGADRTDANSLLHVVGLDEAAAAAAGDDGGDGDAAAAAACGECCQADGDPEPAASLPSQPMQLPAPAGGGSPAELEVVMMDAAEEEQEELAACKPQPPATTVQQQQQPEEAAALLATAPTKPDRPTEPACPAASPPPPARAPQPRPAAGAAAAAPGLPRFAPRFTQRRKAAYQLLTDSLAAQQQQQEAASVAASETALGGDDDVEDVEDQAAVRATAAATDSLHRQQQQQRNLPSVSRMRRRAVPLVTVACRQQAHHAAGSLSAAVAGGSAEGDGSEEGDAIEEPSDSGGDSDWEAEAHEASQLPERVGAAGVLPAVPRLGRLRAAPVQRQGVAAAAAAASESDADDAHAGGSSGNGSSDDNDFEAPATARSQQQRRRPPSRSARAAGLRPAQQQQQQQQQQQPLLLLPQFNAATAWRYSSGNLQRLSQGAWGSKPRFRPVLRPESLLRTPALTLQQLMVSQGAATLAGGRIHVPQASPAASLLTAMLGQRDFDRLFPAAPQGFQHPAPTQWQQQQQQPGGSLQAARPDASTSAAHAAAADCDGGALEDDEFDWAAVDQLEAQHVAQQQRQHQPWVAQHPQGRAATPPRAPWTAPLAAPRPPPLPHLTTALDDLRLRRASQQQQQQPCQQQPAQQPAPALLQEHQRQPPCTQHADDPFSLALADLMCWSDGDEGEEGCAGGAASLPAAAQAGVHVGRAPAAAVGAADTTPAAASAPAASQPPLLGSPGLQIVMADDQEETAPAEAAAAWGSPARLAGRAALPAAATSAGLLGSDGNLGSRQHLQGSGAAPQPQQPGQQQRQDPPAGLSQLQQLHAELEDLTCQLVFLDECEAWPPHTSNQAGAPPARPTHVDSTGSSPHAAAAAAGDGALGQQQPVALDTSVPPQPAAGGIQAGALSQLWDAEEADRVTLVECVAADEDEDTAGAAPRGALPEADGTPASQGTQQDAAGGSGDGQRAAAAAAATAAGLVAPAGRASRLLAGSKRAGSTIEQLLRMAPAERSAWAAAARERQQAVFGRFIELALQGQAAAVAAASGSCGLQQLMELVSGCIQEVLQAQHQQASSSSATRGLDAMQLIRMVSSRHQAITQQARAGRAGGGGAGGAHGAAMVAGAPAVGSTSMVAQQRMFLALLNVAHQTNMAAAAAGGQAGGEATAGAGGWGVPGCTRIRFL